MNMSVHSEALRRAAVDTGTQAAQLVELTQQTSTQTDEVVKLTAGMKGLTVAITWLTLAAVMSGGIQAVAILVHFYRWYRGWL